MAYTPANMTTGSSGLAHLATVFYDRTALTALRKKFFFDKGADHRTLQQKVGKTVQMYRYSQLGANVTATNEGTVGTPVDISSATISATISQYADFISFSDLLVETAIDNDIVEVGADLLGYRGGLTADTLTRNEVDSVASSIDVSLLGDYFSGADVANIRHRLAGLDIRPFPDGYFPALAHPYVMYDFIHDPAVGGFVDVAKQHPNMEGNKRLFTLEDRAYVAMWSGVSLWESTNVTVVTGTPNKYRCYFFGQEGLGAIDLAGHGPTRTTDQNQTKFSINVIRDAGNNIANPEGKIKAAVSYNFVYVAKILDTNPYRMRKIDAPTSLGL